ncbi:hypothetical protein F2Q69_00022612 [Brassica cretica]|uniref:Uncharacterized protein n=1 Tax=Brassica cretica TaxID=69181 RepID=A0A8S9QKU9_BRACR|nr:hypothetical protein F2Q69_00022612 [Brassica cretica]
MGECAMLGRGSKDLVRTSYRPYSSGVIRACPEGVIHKESIWHQEDALWRQTTNGSFLVCDWLVLVLDRLSLPGVIRACPEGVIHKESIWHQEDALWRQTTNGSFLVCDWLVLVLDRLSLPVKTREPRL